MCQQKCAPQMPAGMVAVSQDDFFRALNADPRDIMPRIKSPYFSTWETKMGEVWGWTTPGYSNPRDEKVYAVFPAAIVKPMALVGNHHPSHIHQSVAANNV